ncbi:unnamed protein product [Rhizoctonia solani]|uniref:Uncharacterized protein n=1 Tax=Rhizoctonia solani TaxID=456999 RepID=A0A8H7I7F6_9AGAM|nr:hypothetical protein RHS04_01654 [Rhizoctonia solani]KAF8750857.1 hypothetical protein RHS01_09111 [Rhizoctonia solani]CAE6474712.1 unnamed protein product [Rhizoctonia solani]
MDFEPLLEFLQPHLPPFVFHLLLNLASSLASTINTLSYALTHPSDPDSTEALKSLVPSLLSFLALYFTIVSVYRTIRSAINLVFFLVKWIGILSMLVLGFSYAMRGNAAESFGDLAARLHEFEAAYKEHAQPPKEGKTGSRSVWDHFDARDRDSKDSGKLWWKKDKDTTPPASTFGYVYEQVSSYKWVWDALVDTREDTGSERVKRAKKEKNKPQVNAKSKPGQRVR